MVEVDAAIALVGPDGPLTLLDAFEGRRQLIAYYYMWYEGRPAPEQCEGCTWVTSQVERAGLPSFARHHLRGLVPGAVRREHPLPPISWAADRPWYSAHASLDTLLVGAHRSGRFYLVCYVRDGDRVFETYWTTGRGVEVLDYNYALMDLTVFGRQEPWEDSPAGWPQPWQDEPARMRTNGRPIAQWSRLEAGRSDDLTARRRSPPET